MRGRKPEPTALRILDGREPTNPDEPLPAPIVPAPPEHVTGAALDEWNRVVPELAALGLLTRLDAAALAGYCVAYARWADAERRVAEQGAVVKSPSGFPIQNPYLGIANRALKQIKEFCVEFGLTPSARVRVKAAKPAAQPGFANWLKGRQQPPPTQTA